MRREVTAVCIFGARLGVWLVLRAGRLHAILHDDVRSPWLMVKCMDPQSSQPDRMVTTAAAAPNMHVCIRKHAICKHPGFQTLATSVAYML
jgi:hypothetical protein